MEGNSVIASCSFARRSIAIMALATAATCGAHAAPVEGNPETTAQPSQVDGETREAIRRWYFSIGAANAHPKLKSEELIRDYFDPIMNTIAPGHGDVFTVGDLRDMWLLWPPFVSVGCDIDEHWSFFWEVGYSAGTVRTKTNSTSIILLPLHTDFSIMRGAFYTGVGLDYYPFGHVPQREFHGIAEHVKAARPFIGGRATYTYALYEAKIKIGFKPFRDFASLKLSDEWGIPSFGPAAGFDLPLTKKSLLSFNASYQWFTDQQDDFNGPSYTLQWKHYFGSGGPADL